MSESEKKGILDNYSDVLTTVDLMSILHTGRTLTYKMLKEVQSNPLERGVDISFLKNISKNFSMPKKVTRNSR